MHRDAARCNTQGSFVRYVEKKACPVEFSASTRMHTAVSPSPGAALAGWKHPAGLLPLHATCTKKTRKKKKENPFSHPQSNPSVYRKWMCVCLVSPGLEPVEPSQSLQAPICACDLAPHAVAAACARPLCFVRRSCPSCKPSSGVVGCVLVHDVDTGSGAARSSDDC